MTEEEPQQCGLCYQMTLTRNPHPQAGKLYLDGEGRPTQSGPYVTAVGSVWECIPCLLQNVHRRAQRESRLRRQVEEIQIGYPNYALGDVLTILADMVEHVQSVHDCDQHGYEIIKAAAEAARFYEPLVRAGVS